MKNSHQVGAYFFHSIQYVNHSTFLVQEMRDIQENVPIYSETVINAFSGSIQVSVQKYL